MYQESTKSFILDKKTREIVLKYSKSNTTKQVICILTDWLIIILSIIFSLQSKSIFIRFLAIFIIATRQHALLVMFHEGSHNLLFKNKYLNDFISNVFCGWPVFFSVDMYRSHHLKHHFHTNTQKDPDWIRKVIKPEWQFPQNLKTRSLHIFKYFIIGGPEWIKLAWLITKKDLPKQLFLAFIFAAMYFLNLTQVLFIYWIIPMLTVFPVIQKIRSTAEHFGLPCEHDLNKSRNIITNPVMEFIFTPHNVNYHLLHHLFPSIPQHNLKAAQTAFMQLDTYRKLSHNNDGLFKSNNSFWTDLGKNKPIHVF